MDERTLRFFEELPQHLHPESPAWFHINRCLESTVELLRYVPDAEKGRWELKVVGKREATPPLADRD